VSVYRPTYTENGETRTSPTWWIEFKDHRAIRRRMRGYSDKRTTSDLERRIEQLVHVSATDGVPTADLRRWCETLAPRVREKLADFGLLDARQIAAAAPIADHVRAWEAHLIAKGTRERQRSQVAARVRKTIKVCGFASLGDLDVAAVERFLRVEREAEARPISSRTANFYGAAMRQFSRWAYRTGLVGEDPLRALASVGNVERDRRRERRALTPDELRKLLDVTMASPDRFGLPGPVRALVYRLAAETGLRRNEVKSLVVSDLDLADAGAATLRVRAVNAKNGRATRLPLRIDVARLLARHVEGRDGFAPVFVTPPTWRAAEMLRADLDGAEIAYRDDAGRVVDFHALRTTFGTNLARGKVAVQLAQRLMRHCDPRLTTTVYTVLSHDDERAAVAALPDMSNRDATPTGEPTALGSRLGSETQTVAEAPGRCTRDLASKRPAPDAAEAAGSVSKTGVALPLPRVRIPTPPPPTAPSVVHRGPAAPCRIPSPRAPRYGPSPPSFSFHPRRDAGAVERARLESACTGNRT
jgi:integrase